MGRTLFVILGVARSGTSAISRAMRIFGADHGTHLLAPDDTNPKGYWEDAEVLAIDAGLLEASHAKWQQVGFVFDGQHLEYRQRAIRFLQEIARKTERFAIKEPRMARLLAFWQPLFELTGWDCRYIIVLRNPISVAASLHHLKQLDATHAALLWAEYLMNAIRRTAGETRVVLDYDRLVADPETILRAAGEALGKVNVDPAEMRDYCCSFMASELRHTAHDLSEVFASPEIPAIVATFYSQLLRCAQGELTLDSPEIEASMAGLERLWHELQPIWRWVGRLDTQLERSKAEIARSAGYIDEISAHLTANDGQIAALSQALADRDAHLAAELVERAAQAEQLAAQTERLNRQFARLIAQEAELEHRQQSITARDNLIATITSSKSWKLTQPLRRMRTLLVKTLRSKQT